MKRMKKIRILLALLVLLSVLSAAGCGGAVPTEPPQLTVGCMAGDFQAMRVGFEWDVMKRGSEVGTGVIADGVDPLTYDFTPIPIREKESILFVFPEGMEPDGNMTGSFYPMKNGKPDRDNPLGVYIRPGRGEYGQYGENVYGYYPQDNGYPTEGVYVLRAQWNRPRWRGRCIYAFAVTGID